MSIFYDYILGKFRLKDAGATTPADVTRITNLENGTKKVTYFESVAAAPGTVTVPTGGTILLDQFEAGIDAYVSTIVNGQPTGIFPKTAGGVEVDVSSFNASGNFVLTGTPSAFPVAIIYKFSISVINYNLHVNQTNEIDVETFRFGDKAGDVPQIGTDFVASELVSLDANKKLQPLDTATYPSLTELSYVKGLTSAAQTQINSKQASLGFTPENAANKDATSGYVGLTLFKINFKNAANTIISFFTNTNTVARTYTFQNRDGTIADDTDLATKQNSLGFTAENIANKATDFSVLNDTLYPTTNAVNNQILAQLATLDSKPDVAYASTVALPANTYNNGTLGVGATLTGNSNGPLIIDSVTILVGQVGQRILVAGEAAPDNNGWYTITVVGVVAVSKYVLTRATESDQAAEIGAGYLTGVVASNTVTPGTLNNGKVFISIAADPFTVGTTSLTFSQVGGTYTNGNGISLSGSTFSIDTSVTVDKTTAQTLTNKTLTSPILTTPDCGTPSALIGTNISGATNNFGNRSVAVTSAAGTTTLTVSSLREQILTGTTTQTFQLPDCTTLYLGYRVEINNNSTDNAIINDAGGNLLFYVMAGGYCIIECTNIGSANGVWDYHFLNSKKGRLISICMVNGNQTNSSNPAALTNITELVTPTLLANKRYYILGNVATGCNNTGGVQFAAVVPTGATIYGCVNGISTTATAWLTQELLTSGTATGVAHNRVNATSNAQIYLEINMGANAGTCQFQFKNGVLSQVATIYQTGTALFLQELT